MVLETDFHVFKNLSADLLVGNVFFQENEVKIDYKNRIVIFSDGLVEIPFLKRGENPILALLLHQTFIPPNSQKIVTVRCQNPNQDKILLIEPIDNNNPIGF